MRFNTTVLELDTTGLQQGGAIVRSGGLVVFPTETVYGLGANALDPTACKKIFTAKGRPLDNPLIVHLSSLEEVNKYTGELTRAHRILMEHLMPGPITFIVPKNSIIPDMVTANLPTVALRIPALKEAREFIAYAGVPIAAPSANRSGRPSPTTFEMAYQAMAGRVEAILKGNPCEVGLESSVVRIIADRLELLRPGFVSFEDLKFWGNELGLEVIDLSLTPITEAPSSPGLKYEHYQPAATVFLFSSWEELTVSSVQFPSPARILYCKEGDRNTDPAVLSPEGLSVITFDTITAYARNLFYQFYLADQEGFKTILAWYPPTMGLGLALRNRLIKASSGKFL